jgi:hypothetical protein
MSAGSAASNLGYGNITPNSNINGNFVNKDNSNYSGGFGSNEIPGLPGLAGAKYNVNAAAGYIPGLTGGGKKLKKKIKNITKRYKMSKRSLKRKVSGMKRRIKSGLSRVVTRMRGRTRGRSVGIGGSKKKKRTQRGGYSQYQNNLPMTPTYSTGGVLSAGNLGLANPVPYQVLSNCTNCVDNFNAYEMKGFPSRGH